MRPPSNPHEVQRLTGRVAALGRFLSRSADRCLPFFKALKKPKEFAWTAECQKSFEELKDYLGRIPMLTRPEEGEPLLIYLAAAEQAVSSVVVKEKDGVQHPVYYISRVLRDAEVRYPNIEKLTFSLILSARKLRHYFQGHTIHVLTDQPLRQVLSKPDASGRLLKWAIELSEFDLHYKPRMAIKGQALADFVVELADQSASSGRSGDEELENARWLLYVDGSATSQSSGAGVVLVTPDGEELKYSLRFGFPTSNNEAEYEALIAGLKLAEHFNSRNLTIYCDSLLVVNHVSGNYEAKSSTMQRYLGMVKTLLSKLPTYEIVHISREENRSADSLSKLASGSEPGLSGTVHIQELCSRSIEETEVNQIGPAPETWMSPIINYKLQGTLPDDLAEAQAIRRRDPWYMMEAGQLYRRSYSGPYLKCITPEEGSQVFAEAHEGSCGAHEGEKALIAKVLRAGFYWPTLRVDAHNYVRRCDECQKFAPIPRRPATDAAPITSAWPFAQWGMDLLGPLPPASGGRKFIILAVDYFTKWAEAEPLAKITEEQVKGFVWKNIVTRFGVPRAIITDNGTQFTGRRFFEFCEELGIQQRFTSVAHPQCNGQTEVTNRIILQGLKKRVGQSKGRWAEELPSILWSYRTTPRSSTAETPFSLVYGTEAMVPVETLLSSSRAVHFSEKANDEHLRVDLDLAEERREQAHLRTLHYKQKMARYYNSKVKTRGFNDGDLVLRKTEVSQPAEARGKLAPTWEGPYQVQEVVRPGVYRLKTLEGSDVPRTWNISNLKKYYV